MYCQKCGKEVMANAQFCSSCGAPASNVSQVQETGDPVLELKPVFVPLVTMLSVLPIQLFLTVWGAGFFGGIGMAAVKALELNLPPWFTFVFFGCLFFFGVPLFVYVVKKKSYAKTIHRFFTAKLDYYEGFFTIEEKTISYKNITEVNLRKGIFQRQYGLGTIFLSTPATGYSRGRSRSGIAIADIENPDEVYQHVKNLVGKFS